MGQILTQPASASQLAWGLPSMATGAASTPFPSELGFPLPAETAEEAARGASPPHHRGDPAVRSAVHRDAGGPQHSSGNMDGTPLLSGAVPPSSTRQAEQASGPSLRRVAFPSSPSSSPETHRGGQSGGRAGAVTAKSRPPLLSSCVPPSRVVSFLYSVTRRVMPAALIGSRANWRCWGTRSLSLPSAGEHLCPLPSAGEHLCPLPSSHCSLIYPLSPLLPVTRSKPRPHLIFIVPPCFSHLIVVPILSCTDKFIKL